MQKQKLLILIPCYNEEKNIRIMLPRVKYFANNIQHRFGVEIHILVVNDGSCDKSAYILDEFEFNNNISVVHHRQNQGYGQTLITGFKFAQQENYDWIITFDMDLQHEPNYLITFARKCLTVDKEISMISGSRYLSEKLLWQKPWKDRFIVNSIISGILFQYKIPVTDAFCGFKAIRTSSLIEIPLKEKGYEMPLEFWLKFQTKGFKFIEIPVPLIYKSQSGCLSNGADEKDLLKKGKERILYYIKIIEKYAGNGINKNHQYLADLFGRCFVELPEITSELITSVFNRIFQHVIHLKPNNSVSCPIPI